MTKPTILICDDEETQAKDWRDSVCSVDTIQDKYDVHAPPKGEIQDAVRVLLERQKTLREGKECAQSTCMFDSAQILIVDYDLLFLSDTEPDQINAERIAALPRPCSNCGFIAVLNQYPGVDFDLTLKGHPESRADINIPAKHLDNPGLWTEPFTEFRPWHWPLLPLAAERHGQRVKDIRQNLEKPILEFLGFPDEAIERMSRTALGFLHPTNPRKATFREFVVDSGNAADRKDAQAIRDRDYIVARVAGARISKWLERMVLASQDILIDPPHLVERMPFLLNGPQDEVDSWNATVSLAQSEGLRIDKVEKYRFAREHWLSRPAFWWPSIDIDEALTKQFVTDKDGNPSDLVFREDVSNFGVREVSLEFIAAFHTAYDRRYVSSPLPSQITYTPSVRFAM